MGNYVYEIGDDKYFNFLKERCEEVWKTVIEDQE